MLPHPSPVIPWACVRSVWSWTGGIARLERLEGDRLTAITAMMAEAFDQDPMQQWLFPHAGVGSAGCDASSSSMSGIG